MPKHVRSCPLQMQAPLFAFPTARSAQHVGPRLPQIAGLPQPAAPRVPGMHDFMSALVCKEDLEGDSRLRHL